MDVNATQGFGEVPFMQVAFTLSFRNGTLFTNNNLVGLGSQGNGFGVDVDDRNYHKLFVQATVNTFKWGGEEKIDQFEQFIYFDFIHLGTDTYCENPKIIIEDEELKQKLYFSFKSLNEELNENNYSSCIINNTNSSCELLDFLKITVAKKIK